MKKWFQTIHQEYKESDMSQRESFVEWAIKRKFSFIAKMVCTYSLASLILLHYTRPNWFIFLLYGIVILSILVAIEELLQIRKKK